MHLVLACTITSTVTKISTTHKRRGSKRRQALNYSNRLVFFIYSCTAAKICLFLSNVKVLSPYNKV